MPVVLSQPRGSSVSVQMRTMVGGRVRPCGRLVAGLDDTASKLKTRIVLELLPGLLQDTGSSKSIPDIATLKLIHRGRLVDDGATLAANGLDPGGSSVLTIIGGKASAGYPLGRRLQPTQSEAAKQLTEERHRRDAAETWIRSCLAVDDEVEAELQRTLSQIMALDYGHGQTLSDAGAEQEGAETSSSSSDSDFPSSFSSSDLDVGDLIDDALVDDAENASLD
jgi:hypothetical protein